MSRPLTLLLGVCVLALALVIPLTRAKRDDGGALSSEGVQGAEPIEAPVSLIEPARESLSIVDPEKIRELAVPEAQSLAGYLDLTIGFSDDFEGARATDVQVTCETGALAGTVWHGTYRAKQESTRARLPVGGYRVELLRTGASVKFEIERAEDLVPVRFDLPKLARLELQLLRTDGETTDPAEIECRLFTKGRLRRQLAYNSATERWVGEVLPTVYEMRCRTTSGRAFEPVELRFFPGVDQRVLWLQPSATLEVDAPQGAVSYTPSPVSTGEWRRLEFELSR